MASRKSARQKQRERALQREEPQREVPTQVEQFIERNPEVVARMISVRAQFSGPLPAPETLRQYGEVMPGLDERIVSMAEREQGHRHDLDRSLVRIFSRGQWLGFALGLISLAVGAYLSMQGHEGFGIAAFVGSVAVIAGSLLFGRRGKRTEP